MYKHFLKGGIKRWYKHFTPMFVGVGVFASMTTPSVNVPQIAEPSHANSEVVASEEEPPSTFPAQSREVKDEDNTLELASTEGAGSQYAEPVFPVSGQRIRYTDVVSVTAYSLEEAQTDSTPCIPANGEDLCKMREEQGFHDTIAANFLPFGTKVRFRNLDGTLPFGEKVFYVRDRMNKRYPHRVDIVMDSRELAKAHGLRRMKIEILY